MLRLAEHTQANITQLTHSQIQIQLGHGMANYSVYKNSDADAEIDTPNVAIRPIAANRVFGFWLLPTITRKCWSAEAKWKVTTPQGGTRVGQNQFITIQGTGADEQYKIGEAPARDDFDQWNTDRDNMIRNSVSRQRTNDYYVGTEDLDAHGTWSEVPDYGPVWRPTVSDPTGRPIAMAAGCMSLIGDGPGFRTIPGAGRRITTGRWMYVDGGWGWWPGPAYGYPYYRPIWAPAYVSFYGWGGGHSDSRFWGWGSIGFGCRWDACDHFHPVVGPLGAGVLGGIGDILDGNRGGFAPLHGGTRFSKREPGAA